MSFWSAEYGPKTNVTIDFFVSKIKEDLENNLTVIR